MTELTNDPRPYYQQLRLHYRVAADVWGHLPTPAICALRKTFEKQVCEMYNIPQEQWTGMSFERKTKLARQFNMGE